MKLSLTLAFALSASALSPPAEAALPSFATGFSDLSAFQTTGTNRVAAADHARQARGRFIRLNVDWASVQPDKPPTGAIARDPGWVGYQWGDLDETIKDITSAGLTPAPLVSAAPRWAEGPGRPQESSAAPRGAWKPSVAAFRNFAAAIVKRYSGKYTDPLQPGKRLPKVRYWQVWNEPNLTNFLAPQWVRSGGQWKPWSPNHYKRLLNAFYSAAKKVSRDTVIVTGGTAPYGDPKPGERRMQPALFFRYMVCVSGRSRPRASKCTPAHFDALAHHPYPIGGPSRKALNPDDVAIPDFRKLTRPLAVAIRAGNVLPRQPKKIWATEFAWDSSPPDPLGVPIRTHARYISESFHILWEQGVDVGIWWQLRDELEGQGYPFTLQSGIYFTGASVAEDERKLSFRAFRFPFTAARVRGRAEAWGISPRRGKVVIEQKRSSRWVKRRTLTVGSNRVFRSRVAVKKGSELRARRGGVTSLPTKVR